MPVIGIDFDNTIVCYDPLFFQAARDRGLIPPDFPAAKEPIRDHLRAKGKEDQWTELQAEVYGRYIEQAEVFPGFLEFLTACQAHGFTILIISHKTIRPYRGPNFDLRAAATRWLVARQIVDLGTGMSAENVYFEDSKRAKLERIRSTGCELFIDDLPEFLAEAEFPPRVDKVLFDPLGRARSSRDIVHCRCWRDITQYALERFAT